jgi:hypothetical protein
MTLLRAQLLAELAAGQDMEMQVVHRLAGVLAAVGDDPEALVEPILRGDFCDRLEAFGHERGIVRRDLSRAGDVLLGYDENMDRRLRVQVVEGEDVVVLVALRRRDFPDAILQKRQSDISATSLYSQGKEYDFFMLPACGGEARDNGLSCAQSG